MAFVFGASPTSPPISVMLMTIACALSSHIGIDAAAIAFLGLGILMLTGVYRMEDLRSEGEALGILIWFSVLFTLSSSLNQLGFMTYVGDLLSHGLDGLGWPVVYGALVCLYVLIHCLFVSQSAQLADQHESRRIVLERHGHDRISNLSRITRRAR